METLIIGLAKLAELHYLCISLKARPRILAHGHREIFGNLLFPYQETACGRHTVEIVSTPNNLILAHTEKLLEEIIIGCFIPFINVDGITVHLAIAVETAFVESATLDESLAAAMSVRRVGYGQIKIIIGQRFHIFHAIHVEYIAPKFFFHILKI